jgi:peptidylprolyl isomerase
MFKIVLVIAAVLLLIVFYQRSGGGKQVAEENRLAGEEFLATNGQLEGVKTLASGMQIQVIQAGTGTEHPGPRDTVKVHYHGTLIDGTVFDSSVQRGQPIEFGLHQVIPGWTEGLQLMVVGEKARLFIPSNLAYGNRAAGKIKPGSSLIFEVELLGINK